VPKSPGVAEQVLATGGGNFLPGMNLGGIDESTLDLQAILATIPGLEGGPSTGGFSNSLTLPYKKCHRLFYYSRVKGYQKKARSIALDVGALVHACFELHYLSSGLRTFEPCEAVAAAGGVQMAADARRYVYATLSKYGQEEADTWDIRGIELQGMWFMPPEKFGSRKVYMPASCRHDLCVALREPGAPCHPPGQSVPSGVYIVDHKTAHALSYELTKGFGMDPQFLLNALIYEQAEAAQYGPLRGVIVSVIAKHKVMTPDSIFRIYSDVSKACVAEFYKEEFRPTCIEIYERMSVEENLKDARCWKKNRAACVTRYGLCPFFDVCDTPGGEEAVLDAFFNEDPGWQFRIEKLAQPPADVKRTAGKTEEELSAADQVKAQRKAEREARKQTVLSAFISNAAQAPAFHPMTWMGGGLSQKEVQANFAEYLTKCWPIGTRFDIQATGLVTPITFTVTVKSLNWTTEGKRGSFAWRTLAKAVSADWWSPSLNSPSAAPQD
jgi:hypothetical protein